jgi:hypothetical protein
MGVPLRKTGNTPYISGALQAAVFLCGLPSPSLPAFTIHQNAPFGGWGMEGPPQKLHPFGCTWPLFAKITFVVM